MAAPALSSLYLAVLAALLVVAAVSPAAGRLSKVGLFPPTCDRIECPKFEVVSQENGFEVRRYNVTEWMSTSPIEDISLVSATRTGFLKLFNYIQGKNKYQETIEMTAPVITEVSPSDGPFCASSFVVSFYVPQKNQADPPPADGLHLQTWGYRYIAVRQFGGFVKDEEVGQEAAALFAGLSGSKWAAAIEISDPTSTYTVAQYNSPFEFSGRVNEIWMVLDILNINQYVSPRK